jgi:alkanesulfonate monooxygenase SsuD/methylene tetrahydromethanopterin reductase-like flavin-dependent oxidoreductase (luciferase family)
MLASQANWIMGTPDQARAQLEALSSAGIERALLSVNSDMHLAMLPHFASAIQH